MAKAKTQARQAPRRTTTRAPRAAAARTTRARTRTRPASAETPAETSAPTSPTRTRARAAGDVFAHTLHFRVEKHYFGEHRKASLAGLETDADKELLALHKRVVNMPETAKIRTCDGHFRDWLNTVAHPFSEGVWLVPVGMVERVAARAEEWERQRVALVDLAADAYPAQADVMRQRLGHLFSEQDYGSVARFKAQFWIAYRFVDFGVPHALQEIKADVFARERAKLEAEAGRARDLIEQHLAGSLLKITDHLRDLLTPRANGKRAALRDGALDDLLVYLDTIALRDVTGFKDLRAVTTQLRRTAEGLSVDSLRDDAALRERTAAALTEARETIAGLVVVDGIGRGIRVRDDDGAEAGAA